LSLYERADLTAEDTEDFAEERKAFSSAILRENLCALCVDISFDKHSLLILTHSISLWSHSS